MRLPIFIAFRYLFSKKKINAIHVINGIAMLGFGVGAFAMVVILSAFNGFEQLVSGLISNYDPDISVSAAGKKVFVPTDELVSQIQAQPEVIRISKSLEEKVVVKYNDRQEIGLMKGVDSLFNREKFDSLVVLGHFQLKDSSRHLAVFGGGLAGKLGIFPGSHEVISVYVPRRDVEFSNLNPMAALNVDFLRSSGIFIVHEEIDNEVFITSLDFASELLNYPQAITDLELELKEGANRAKVKGQLETVLGPDWKVTTRDEQNEVIYKIFRSEKWFTYAILALVLLISAFNIFGSLIMLVLDKRKDISVLKSMGAQAGLIRKVFLWQGSYISMLGGLIGLGLGVLIVLGQYHFGWLKLENSIVEAYPVVLSGTDVLITLTTVVILGYVMSIYPASRAAKVEIDALN